MGRGCKVWEVKGDGKSEGNGKWAGKGKQELIELKQDENGGKGCR